MPDRVVLSIDPAQCAGNLHKLPLELFDTPPGYIRTYPDPEACQALLPESFIISLDPPYIGIIDYRVIKEKGPDLFGSVGKNDLNGVFQRDRGIRDDKIRKDGVGPAAVGTPYAQNKQLNMAKGGLDLSLIVGMPDQSGMATFRTHKLMKLQIIDHMVIIFLRNNLDHTVLNYYHKIVQERTGADFWWLFQGDNRFCLSFSFSSYGEIIHDRS